MHLTKREHQVFSLLSRGKTYLEIRKALGISAANLHVLCWKIRQKTSAGNVQMEPVTTPENKPLTTAQRAVLRALAEGKTYREICTTLGVSLSTAQNHACQGRKKLSAPALDMAHAAFN